MTKRAAGICLLSGGVIFTCRYSTNSAQLHQSGPFNPTASIPQRIVKKIVDLEFLEMAEVMADVDRISRGGWIAIQ